MKAARHSGKSNQAFTLLEMSIVLMVLLALISTGLFVSKKYDEWKLGRQASETLRTVYSAQRMYLADNPTVSVSSLTAANVIPYLPNNAAALPTVKSLTGATLSIMVNVSPPVINAGSGVTYDPSGSNTDSLWDVGKLIRALTTAISITLASATLGSEFKHVGDYLLQSHFKITGDKITPIPMKPIAFRVFTDGVSVRVAAEGDDDSHTTFEIYRSDGIGRQHGGRGALEVIPGLQASSHIGGVLRHLRLTSESMTITTFPGVSDQTIVSYSVAAEPTPVKPPAKTELPSRP